MIGKLGVGIEIGVGLGLGNSLDSEDSSSDGRSNLNRLEFTRILAHLWHWVHLRHVVPVHRIGRCVRLLHGRTLPAHRHRRRLTIRCTHSCKPLIMDKSAIVYFATALRTSLSHNYLWKYLQGTVLNLSALGTKVCAYPGALPGGCWLLDRSALSLLTLVGICI